MPTNLVKTPADESKWSRAKSIVGKEYPGAKSKNPDKFYAITTHIFENMKKHAKDLIHGGKADGKTDSAFSALQIRMGQKVEREHTDKPSMAREIARDHLTEIPDYYTRLKKMEDAAPKTAADFQSMGRLVAASADDAILAYLAHKRRENVQQKLVATGHIKEALSDSFILGFKDRIKNIAPLRHSDVLNRQVKVSPIGEHSLKKALNRVLEHAQPGTLSNADVLLGPGSRLKNRLERLGVLKELEGSGVSNGISLPQFAFRGLSPEHVKIHAQMRLEGLPEEAKAFGRQRARLNLSGIKEIN